jgi:cytochrome P450
VTDFPLGASITVEQLSADPYPLFARLREREPVTWAPAVGQWLITSRDIAMEVLRDHERFRTDDPHSPIRDTFGAQLLSTEGEAQRRYKSACAPPFNARAAEESRPLVEAIVERALAQLGQRPTADLRADYAAPIALEVIARVIGLPVALDEQLRRWYDTFVDALMNYERDPGTRTRAHAAVRAFATIAPRLAAPDADETTLASLARAHPRLLDDAEIGSNALIVMFGGIETTRGSSPTRSGPCSITPTPSNAPAPATTNSIAAWRNRCAGSRGATCTRYAAQSCTLHGAEIPAGAVVQCMWGDESRPGPLCRSRPIRPWRQESLGHAAFGFGRHFCLGAALARSSARRDATPVRALPALRFDPAVRAPHRARVRKGRVAVQLT